MLEQNPRESPRTSEHLKLRHVRSITGKLEGITEKCNVHYEKFSIQKTESCCRNMTMGLNVSYFTKFLVAILAIILYCEFIIYYVVLLQCLWPQLDSSKEDPSIHVDSEVNPVRVLLLADTHLLGSRKGHWFDKLRREWQMHRAFQTAMVIHKPDVVFVLGDLFDEGLWCSEQEFLYYVKRFEDLFEVPTGTQMFVAVGNHDIGFHYSISPYLHERFATAFGAPPVRMVTIKGNHFVLINSMAMEGDGCFLCRPAELQLQKISRKLKCSRGVGKCDPSVKLVEYSRPVLLQHFPMYRESDADCHERDEAPEDVKTQKFRERWECLSRESSDMLQEMLQPRLIVTGHTHHGCHRLHSGGVHEYTLPSFSWRNKNGPSFMLALFTPNNYAVAKCYMPQESTVICLYGGGALLILLWIALTYRRLCRRSRWFKNN